MRFPARLLGVLFAFLLVFLVAKTSFAQTANYIPQNTQTSASSSVPNNLNTYAQSVLFSVMSTVGCQLAGIDPINRDLPCVGAGLNAGAIGTVGNMISALYVAPVHASDYVRYLSSNFGIAKNANAQLAGTGLTQLTPLVSIWVIFRNLVYLLFVAVLAVIGIAIMLRVRIDPRTVMAVQNQIPKIIIGLILVTFSLAIAGFLIDIMWVSTYLVIDIIGQANSSISNLINGQIYNNPLGFVNILLGSDNINFHAASSISNVITQTLNPQNTTGTSPSSCDTGGIPVLCVVGDIFANTLGAILNGIFAWLVGTIVGILAFFVISIAILWSLIKLWFALLKAYIFILIHTVLAPFWIVAGLMPGQQTLGFGNWVREMLGNLMAFPAVIGFFMLGKLFVEKIGPVSIVTDNGAAFIPPLLGGVSGNSELGALIGLGFILASPHIVEMTKVAFKSKGVGNWAIGQGVGAAIGVINAPAGRIGGSLFGKDIRTGEAKAGTAYVGRKFGRIARGFTGGNFTRKTDKDSDTGEVTRREELGLLPPRLSPITSRVTRVTRAVTSRIPGLRKGQQSTPPESTTPPVTPKSDTEGKEK